MYKEYPYLPETYSATAVDANAKIDFLSSIDKLVNQHQYVNIILLDWQENPIKDISGEITDGTITKSGTSSSRIVGSLGCKIDGTVESAENIKQDFSINKKIFLEIGIRNDTDQYTEYPILWFPQGLFYITDFSMDSSSSDSVNINLSLKDKICKLDGTIGGTFPATTQLDIEEDEVNNLLISDQKVLIYDLIMEVVNHYGEEDITNIVIEDIDRKASRVLQWINTEKDLCVFDYYTDSSKSSTKKQCCLKDELSTFPFTIVDGTLQTFSAGEDIGYELTDFVYGEELTMSPGDTVVTFLDKIVEYLGGNYEYFYDIFGVFHFRAIKNYLNITLSTQMLEESEEERNYLLEQGLDADYYIVNDKDGQSIYTFEDNINLISVSSKPQYSAIKNDYILQGTYSDSDSGITYDVRYHLAIDEKPEIDLEGYTDILVYKDPDTTCWTLGKVPDTNLVDSLNSKGASTEVIYGLLNRQVMNVNSELCNDLKKLDKYYKDNSLITLYQNSDEDISVDYDSEDYVDNAYRYYKNQCVSLISKVYRNNATSDEISQLNIYAQFVGAIDEIDALMYPSTKSTSITLEPGFYKWDGEGSWKELEWDRYYSETDPKYKGNIEIDKTSKYIAKEWRTQLILQGLEATTNGTDAGYYYPELIAMWPTIYNLNTQKFYAKEDDYDRWHALLCNGKYYLDFIDAANAKYGEYSVSNIGRRSQVETNEDINSLFDPVVDYIYFMSETDYINDYNNGSEYINDIESNGYEVIQVSDDIYDYFATGGKCNGAYDTIRTNLLYGTNYQRTLDLTAIPVFYLYPNSRVTVNDNTTDTFGDFIISDISLTLGTGNTMSVTCTEAIQQF